MTRLISVVLMSVLIGGTAYAGILDRYCAKHPYFPWCTSYTDPEPPAPGTLQEAEAVAYLSDETPTYVFSSDIAGNIMYGGACGVANKTQAVVGNNTITWTLTEGTYSNCTIRVGDSNTLTVPTFKCTTKYPVVFVHGMNGSGSRWNAVRDYLENNGWDSLLLITKSITISNTALCDPGQAAEVAEWVEDTLAQFPGFSKIDIVGFSRGGSNVMRALWHGYVDPSKVRYVVTLAGANRICGANYPAIPYDETPGNALYSYYYSDGDPDYDDDVDSYVAYIRGAYGENLYPLAHTDFMIDSTAFSAIIASLQGRAGSN